MGFKKTLTRLFNLGYSKLSEETKAELNKNPAAMYDFAQLLEKIAINNSYDRYILPVAENVIERFSNSKTGEDAQKALTRLNSLIEENGRKQAEYKKVEDMFEQWENDFATGYEKFSLNDFYVFETDEELIFYHDDLNQSNSALPEGRDASNYAIYTYDQQGSQKAFTTLNEFLASKQYFGGVYSEGKSLKSITEFRELVKSSDQLKEITVKGKTSSEKICEIRNIYLEQAGCRYTNLVKEKTELLKEKTALLKEREEAAEEEIKTLKGRSLDDIIAIKEEKNKSRSQSDKIISQSDTLYVVKNLDEIKDAFLFMNFGQDGNLLNLYFHQNNVTERLYNFNTFFDGITMPTEDERIITVKKLLEDDFVKEIFKLEGLELGEKPEQLRNRYFGKRGIQTRLSGFYYGACGIVPLNGNEFPDSVKDSISAFEEAEKAAFENWSISYNPDANFMLYKTRMLNDVIIDGKPCEAILSFLDKNGVPNGSFYLLKQGDYRETTRGCLMHDWEIVNKEACKLLSESELKLDFGKITSVSRLTSLTNERGKERKSKEKARARE